MAHEGRIVRLRNGRDSNAQRLGVKRLGGRSSTPVRSWSASAGTHFHPGDGVAMAKDDTLFALDAGAVEFGTPPWPQGREHRSSSLTGCFSRGGPRFPYGKRVRLGVF